jgi:hypothetical protein
VGGRVIRCVCVCVCACTYVSMYVYMYARIGSQGHKTISFFLSYASILEQGDT